MAALIVLLFVAGRDRVEVVHLDDSAAVQAAHVVHPGYTGDPLDPAALARVSHNEGITAIVVRSLGLSSGWSAELWIRGGTFRTGSNPRKASLGKWA